MSSTSCALFCSISSVLGSLRDGGGSLFVIIEDANDEEMELYGGWDIIGGDEVGSLGTDIGSVLGVRCEWVDGKL